MITANIIVGNENLDGGSAKTQVFFCPTHSDEVPIGRAAQTHPAFVVGVGSPIYEDAVPGRKPDIGGRWMTRSYQIEEGTILKVFGQCKPTFNSHRVNASLYLRARATGPLIRVEFDLTGHSSARYEQVRPITGRFDVLTAAQAQRAGVHIAPAFARFTTASAIEETFRIVQVEPGMDAGTYERVIPAAPRARLPRSQRAAQRTVEIDQANGRIVRTPPFNISGTVTGRTSSTQPNISAVPRGSDGRPTLESLFPNAQQEIAVDYESVPGSVVVTGATATPPPPAPAVEVRKRRAMITD